MPSAGGTVPGVLALAASALLTLGPWTPGPLGPSQGPDLSKNAILNAASDYVREYEERLTYLVADELSVQRMAVLINGSLLPARMRTMRSEVFFVFVPGISEWMAVRDVRTVDGAPAPDRRDVQALLQGDKLYSTAQTIKDFNSRYNLGVVSRNFNEPTLALLVLDRRYRSRFSFEKKSTQSIGGTLVVTLTFNEGDGPTLIRNSDGKPARSKGEMLVDAGTGRVRRTIMQTTIRTIESRLETTYAADERLGLWLPTVFRESYFESGLRQEIDVTSVYTNFRKFGVDVRIK